MKLTALFTTVLVLMLFSCAFGQKLPDKIRGYKVYETKVAVVNSTDNADKSAGSDALVKLGDPEISFNGVLSVAIEIGADITIARQSGQVDFLTFSDFRVNGIAIEIDEYRSAFSFKKNVPASLPKPARAVIGITGVAKAAYKEFIESKKEWAVTGTVFVFGRYKKFGFTFKRVIPIKIELKIKNPLRS